MVKGTSINLSRTSRNQKDGVLRRSDERSVIRHESVGRRYAFASVRFAACLLTPLPTYNDTILVTF
jgi:hypothetical protein